jgi:hypothetical protein
MPTALRTIACMFATALGIVVHHASADTNVPALPVCKPQHEWRTPVPIWTTGLSKDGTLHSAPPEQTSNVIYVGVALDSDAPACKDPPRNRLFDFDAPKGTLRMTKWGRTACATASSTASTPLPRVRPNPTAYAS